MKKVLSLVLVIAMVLSSMSFAFASTSFDDIADTDYSKAIDTLTALGIVSGYEDGTFRPEKTVTRAEMAKLMVVTLGYGDLVSGAKSNFTDTQGHWADSYIALAAGKGLVIGTGDGKFSPDRTVTYDEVLTMVVRALGYTDTCNELKNMTWPTNFKVKAAELDITDDVTMSTAGADRGGVAQVLFNALTATLVSVNSDGDVVKATTQTTNSSGNVVVQYTELLSRIATYDSSYVVEEDLIDPDSKNYAGNLVDLAPYMYQDLKVYLNDDDEVVFVKDTNSVLVEGTVVDILDEDGDSLDDGDAGFAIVDGDAVTVVIEDANGKEFKVAVTDYVKSFYNGEEETIQVEDFADLLYNKSAASITAIVTDTDNDGNVDNGEVAKALVVQKATKGIQVKNDYVTGKSKITGNNSNISLPEDDGDVDLNSITVTGAVDSLEDIVADDVVIAYESISKDTIKLVVVRDTVDGVVTKTNSTSSTIYIDGAKYSLSKVNNSVKYATAPVVGDEGVFYLDNAGKVFAVDTDGAELTDYAYVISSAPGEWSNKMDGYVTEYPQLKLLTADGDTVIYDVLVSVDENTIDDYAEYTDNEASPVVKDQQLVDLDAVAADATKANIRFNRNLDSELVKYSTDSDGKIDEVEVMKTQDLQIDEDDVNDITSDDVIVFNTVDKEVSKVENLINNATHKVLYDDGEIVVIVSSQIESENDGVFGAISSLAYVKNNDGDTVTEVTAFVDGVEVTYLTKDKKTIGNNGFDATTSTAVKFTFNSSDELTSIDPIQDGIDANVKSGNATDVTSRYIEVGSSTYTFASDVAVYIYDVSEDEVTIGDVSDLDEGCATTVYNTANTSNIANIVVQVQP